MTAKPAAALAAVAETPLQAFERSLQARYPTRVIQRFDFPERIKQARAVYMMELTSRDELEAAKYADAVMTDLERKSIRLASECERRECVRASIVGLVTRDDAMMHVNNNGVPFHTIDEWPSKASACLWNFYHHVNGIPTDELLEGLKGSRTIGAPVPPTNATQPSASIG